MGTLILKDILIIFVLSIPVVLLFRRLKLPSILGFLATGALIGPQGIQLIEQQEQVDLLAQLGVTLLLFSVGLEFSLEAFGRVKKQGIFSGLLQISLTTLAGMAIGYAYWGDLYKGVYLGCMMALSSTAVVLSTLSHFKYLDSISGRFATVILILQDLALIPMIVLLPGLASLSPQAGVWTQLGLQLGKAFLLIISVVLVSKYLATPLLRLISKARSRELFAITVISIGLGMAWLTHEWGLSYALGAFMGGMMIGSTEYQYQALSEVKPFQFSFNSIFFVSIGMLLNFHFIADNYPTVFLLILLIPTLKLLITTLSVWVNRLPFRLALVVGIFLGQIGEFSFLLAYLGQKGGAISPFLYQLIISVAVVSMILTPMMVHRAPRIADWVAGWPLFRWLPQEHSNAMQKVSKRMQNHVVICGFGPLGETFGKMLQKHHIPYLVLELNPDTIKKLQKSKGHAFYGDGASEEILYETGIEKARLLAITVPDFLNAAAIIQQARKLNPHIKIITRAKYRNRVEKLYQAGADVVVSEELEGGLEMGRYALKLLDVEKKSVDAFLNQIREFGSADFF